MKIGNHIQCIFLLLFLLLTQGCSAQEKSDDFIGNYPIGTTKPADSSSTTLTKIRQTENWVLSLEEHGNFELKGTGKHVVGFWKMEKLKDKEYKIFLQGGGWAIYGRFDGTSIYFDKTYKMFDNLFSEISFTRKKK